MEINYWIALVPLYLALAAFFLRMENRMTKVETMVKVIYDNCPKRVQDKKCP